MPRWAALSCPGAILKTPTRRYAFVPYALVRTLLSRALCRWFCPLPGSAWSRRSSTARGWGGETGEARSHCKTVRPQVVELGCGDGRPYVRACVDCRGHSLCVLWVFGYGRGDLWRRRPARPGRLGARAPLPPGPPGTARLDGGHHGPAGRDGRARRPRVPRRKRGTGSHHGPHRLGCGDRPGGRYLLHRFFLVQRPCDARPCRRRDGRPRGRRRKRLVFHPRGVDADDCHGHRGNLPPARLGASRCHAGAMFFARGAAAPSRLLAPRRRSEPRKALRSRRSSMGPGCSLSILCSAF